VWSCLLQTHIFADKLVFVGLRQRDDAVEVVLDAGVESLIVVVVAVRGGEGVCSGGLAMFLRITSGLRVRHRGGVRTNPCRYPMGLSPPYLHLALLPHDLVQERLHHDVHKGHVDKIHGLENTGRHVHEKTTLQPQHTRVHCANTWSPRRETGVGLALAEISPAGMKRVSHLVDLCASDVD